MTCISRPFALLVRWQNTSRLTMLLPVYQIQDAEFARLPCEIGAVAGREAWSHEDPSISASISASLSTRSLISAFNAADRWPTPLIDQCSGKLPGAFTLQRNVLAFHDRFTPTLQLQLE